MVRQFVEVYIILPLRWPPPTDQGHLFAHQQPRANPLPSHGKQAVNAELSKATEESIKILSKTEISDRTVSLLLAIPETLEAEQEFLEWLQTHRERDQDSLFKAASRAADKYPPKEE